MILLKSDWDLYPRAIIDTSTRNMSFLRLASLFVEMGVVNNAFHLSLINPDLQGVDPFDENLSDELMLLIMMECSINPWYALREIIMLPPQGSINPIRFKANRSNISLTWCFFNHIDYANIQPRQTGKSASTDCLWAIIIELMGINTHIQLVTKDNPLRRANVGRIKAIIDYLPDYLNPKTGTDADNTEAVTCVTRGNLYKTAVGRSAREAADNLGRGLTSPILHGDELPYIPNIQISLPVALSSGTAARESAKESGGLYGNIFTTTAGKRDTPNGLFAYNLVHDGMYWNEKLYDAPNHETLIKTILKNSTSDTPMINGTFSHRQLGKTDTWLREAIANSRSGEELTKRDYLNIWTSGTESSPIESAILEVIANSEMTPTYNEVTKDRYLMKWYIGRDNILSFMDRGQFIISLDSSNAVGRDNNGLNITDARNMATIASASISEANLYKFALWIGDLIVMYPNTIFVIENKSSAQGIIDVLLTLLPHKGIDPFKRIYNRLVENIELYPEEEKELVKPLSRRDEHFYIKNKKYFGFNTNGNSRAFLYDTVLQHAAKSSGHLVRDMVLSNELKGLTSRNGRIDHVAGGHDDNVIAWLMAHYFVSYSKNLKFYDMRHELILSDVSDNGALETDEDKVLRGKQSKIKLDIERITNDINQAKSAGAKLRSEFMLKKLVRTLEACDDNAGVWLDGVINKVKAEKVKQVKLYDAVRQHCT